MLADLGLLYCALFWGISFVSMKILVGVYPASWILFLRFFTASILVYVFFSRRINKNIKHDFKAGLILGILLFIAIVTQTIGLNYIGGGRSAFISATYVLMVPFMVWALRKIFPGFITLIAAFMCVSGMYLLTGDEVSGTFNVGDFLTLICALMFAVQVLAIARFTKGCDPITLSFAEFFSLGICAFLYSIAFETRNNLIDFESLPELLFTIILCTFGCYMIQICAQKYVKPSRAVIIMSLESVFGLISSVILLGESFTLRTGLGCVLIFSAVLIAELEPFIRKRG
ncbi:MAG: DMT family transporter [Synergistaceae bacterium]|nr:DMT family transporter [Synergistaceae bacterium]MBR0074738.1 DMT family transporter [Synergistaceae bacterium]MBR0078802.1 DMT family transporter [Synergistaceae bacterium]